MAVGDPYPGNLGEPPRSPHNHQRVFGTPVLPLTTHKPWGPPAQARGQLGGCWTPSAQLGLGRKFWAGGLLLLTGLPSPSPGVAATQPERLDAGD